MSMELSTKPIEGALGAQAHRGSQDFGQDDGLGQSPAVAQDGLKRLAGRRNDGGWFRLDSKLQLGSLAGGGYLFFSPAAVSGEMCSQGFSGLGRGRFLNAPGGWFGRGGGSFNGFRGLSRLGCTGPGSRGRGTRGRHTGGGSGLSRGAPGRLGSRDRPGSGCGGGGRWWRSALASAGIAGKFARLSGGLGPVRGRARRRFFVFVLSGLQPTAQGAQGNQNDNR